MYRLDQQVASGGEGRLLRVSNEPLLLAKLYHKPTRQHEQKLLVMIAKNLQQPAHPVITWPIEPLYEKTGVRRLKQFVGFLMPFISDAGTLYSMYHPGERKKLHPQVSKRHLYLLAHNLAYVVATLHNWGYVLGDVNESNFLVNSQLLVTLVDADSLQIKASGLTVYRCLVARPEYVPPELKGVDLSTVDRTEVHDRFGLAVLIFHLLMNGRYPYAGVPSADVDIPRIGLYCKQQGIFPYVKNTTVVPPPNAPPFRHLPVEVQGGFIRSFVYGYVDPEKRPSALEWQRILLRAHEKLNFCQKNFDHIYGSHLDECPWCR
jgi:DNA-binding helix-hairpin-helix protein with protein kinase domain